MDEKVRWVIGPLGYIVAMSFWFGFSGGITPAIFAIVTWIIVTSPLLDM